MIPVPPPILETLAHAYGTTAASLNRFGGGGPESDGIVYSFPHDNASRLLKIMAIPLEEQIQVHRSEASLHPARYVEGLRPLQLLSRFLNPLE